MDDDTDDIVISMEELTLINEENIDLKKLFDECGPEQKEQLIASRQFYDKLLNVLRTSEYVHWKSRRFLCVLDDLSNPEHATLTDIRSSPSAIRHIKKTERMKALQLLLRWIPVLVVEAERECNPLFRRNGTATVHFRKFLVENDLHCSIRRGASGLDQWITGALSKDEFLSRLTAFCPEWRCYEEYVRYEQELFTDEKVSFGDALSATNVHPFVPYLPFALQSAVGIIDRGTIGAVVRIHAVGHSQMYILTCAHVACLQLNPNTAPEIIDQLKKSSYNIGYERQGTGHTWITPYSL